MLLYNSSYLVQEVRGGLQYEFGHERGPSDEAFQYAGCLIHVPFFFYEVFVFRKKLYQFIRVLL